MDARGREGGKYGVQCITKNSMGNPLNNITLFPHNKNKVESIVAIYFLDKIMMQYSC